MHLVDQALQTLTDWFFIAFAALVGVLGLIDVGLQRALADVGVPIGLRRILVLVADVAVIVGVVRVFGGLIRVLLVVFLLLLLVHILIPGQGL